VLRARSPQRFTGRELAELVVEEFPEDYVEKAKNPRFQGSKGALVAQVAAEIGAQKSRLVELAPDLQMRNKPRPRVYWIQATESASDSGAASEPRDALPVPDSSDSDARQEGLPSEAELYPLLMTYLESQQSLHCMRIDERRSSNSQGPGGNHWLHPDIVALEATTEGWKGVVKDCLRHIGGTRARVFSYEVKRKLTRGNVRESFFQAVSNSSWANEAYLVAASVNDSAEAELRMLSSLHGVGLLVLNHRDLAESEVVLPARPRPEMDWQSVDRLVRENEDFADFIDRVDDYLQRGKLTLFKREARKRQREVGQ
jgi:hypothetical protein